MSVYSNSENKLFNCNVSFTSKASDDHVKDFEDFIAGSECKKKELHTKFIPFTKFGSRHFDYPYNRKELTELTKAFGNVVVKLEVKKTSPDRPLKFAQKGEICGTGRIKFCKLMKSTRTRNCMCGSCTLTSSPQTEWGEISVVTAAHVVFDKLEAKHSTCILRYNKKDSTNTVTLEGLNVVNVNAEHDRSEVIYVTHDIRLTRLLIRSIYLFKSKHEKLYRMYKDNPNKNLAILVSHPHGWYKQVSLGTYERKQIDDGKTRIGDRVLTRYSHKAQSCPGSSGAPIYFLGKEDVWTMHPHSGYEEGLGISSTAFERVPENPLNQQHH